MTVRLRSAPAAFWLATFAVAWASVFTVWVLTAALYQPDGQTILEVNKELTVRIAIGTPLVLSIFVWLALHRACREDSRTARRLAGVVAWLLVAFAVVTGFTIGAFVLPAAVALAWAAALTPVR